MLFLGMDTSTTQGSVALVRGTELLCEWDLNVPRTHAERLLPAVKHLLEETGIGLDRVEGLAVTTGPGSFTGLRIALATAKALALVTGIPLVGIPTLDVLAENAASYTGLVCPVLDARKKEVFTALYRRDRAGETLTRLTEYLALSPEKLAERISEPALCLGTGIAVYGERLRAAAGVPLHFPPPECHYPRASVLCRLAMEKFEREGPVRPADLRALYARASDAELGRRA